MSRKKADANNNDSAQGADSTISDDLANSSDSEKEVDDVFSVELVEMVKPDGVPDSAQVHPNEVENYQRGGWLIQPKPESENSE